MKSHYEDLVKDFPFLSGVRYRDEDFLTIIQNHDRKIITYYDMSMLRNQQEKELFLELGDCWYWESNRMIPINIFLSTQMNAFKHCLRTAPMKETEILFGPVTSLLNLIAKRPKKRNIRLYKEI